LAFQETLLLLESVLGGYYGERTMQILKTTKRLDKNLCRDTTPAHTILQAINRSHTTWW